MDDWKQNLDFISPFFIVNSWFLTLAKAFQRNYEAACSTARRSATEKNEMPGYAAVPCFPKWHSIVAHRIRLNSSDVTRLIAAEYVRNK